MSLIFGYDVSSYQSETFPTSGIAFAIAKATENTTYVNPHYAGQLAHARGAGLVVGHYHFGTSADGAAEFAWFARHADVRAGDIIAFDWEESSVSQASRDAFLKAAKAHYPHNRVILYCNISYWKTRDTENYDADGLWIADPSHAAGHPNVKAAWVIHQYSSANGIDHNVANFASEAAMRTWAEGLIPKAPAKVAYPIVATETVHYTVTPRVAFKAAGNITVKRIGLAVRDSKGGHHDFGGSAVNVTLKAGQVWYLSLEGQVLAPGAYTVFGCYQTADGVWHNCSPVTLKV